MYYEEKFIDGVLHCRYARDGDWTQLTKTADKQQTPATLGECYEAAQLLQDVAVKSKPSGDVAEALESLIATLDFLPTDELSGQIKVCLTLDEIAQLKARASELKRALAQSGVSHPPQPDVAELLGALNRVEAIICHEVCSSTNKQIADTGELFRSDISKIRSFILRPVDLKQLKKQEYHNLKVKAFLEQEDDDGQTKRAEQKGGV